ncbi:methylated-DNA--[protein]-cysteine S-methyltransferase [Litoreibacter roseus]|uniref:Methylated-DNA--protein-cysteine methyltransferase n=1 Tax=Litoreibacter roseus TaxID=2601869 RepID=A0A6N6JGK7_9RHOB|nr:methylated-DNA--[protein]-cysteine S-methyltransferase [Litoreibacter roseus]GFE65255.1 methylated-DNA--protein-cysteine methyltransferase [Litoreibacter roseus]
MSPGDLTKASVETPVGRIRVEGSESITSVDWGGPVYETDNPTLSEAVRQITEYFARERVAFDLPLAPRGSAFQQQFYAALQAIPFGETRTYGDIARELGVSAQAIGQACGANPIPILIPCHRVLAATSLGGFSGAGGVEAKVALLKHEGAASLLI